MLMYKHQKHLNYKKAYFTILFIEKLKHINIVQKTNYFPSSPC